MLVSAEHSIPEQSRKDLRQPCEAIQQQHSQNWVEWKHIFRSAQIAKARSDQNVPLSPWSLSRSLWFFQRTQSGFSLSCRIRAARTHIAVTTSGVPCGRTPPSFSSCARACCSSRVLPPTSPWWWFAMISICQSSAPRGHYAFQLMAYRQQSGHQDLSNFSLDILKAIANTVVDDCLFYPRRCQATGSRRIYT